MKQRHPYHLVDFSPWPLVAASSALLLTLGATMYFHNYIGGGYILLSGLFMVIFTMVVWWRDVVRESTFQGHHTIAVQLGLRYGVLLFIVSEAMLFFSFFWAFFHSSLAPTLELGSVWPPVGIETISAWDVPLLNTVVLLLSGLTITWSHHSIISGDRRAAILALAATIGLAIFFTFLQLFEYVTAPFSISDGVYGSTFYMATGFHGMHVLIGTIFLVVCLYRLRQHHFTRQHHFGFEAAAWYWHFVDVVWLFLFLTIYWWGNL